MTSGPAIEHKGELAALLTRSGAATCCSSTRSTGCSPVIEENLYPAMEDFRIDIVTGDGAGARAIPLPIQRFTLVGATTRTGLLSAAAVALRHRRAPRLLPGRRPGRRSCGARRACSEIPIDDAGAEEIARRARGTPRIANRLLRRVRDFADVRGDGRITRDVAEYALGRLEVDAAGLDAGDRRILLAIIEQFDGGPVGIESLAASLAEERDTLEDVYEPYLIQEGFLIRTPRGRQITRRAYDHLGLPAAEPPAGDALLGRLRAARRRAWFASLTVALRQRPPRPPSGGTSSGMVRFAHRCLTATPS